jgi:hypothetical protein
MRIAIELEVWRLSKAIDVRTIQLFSGSVASTILSAASLFQV